jgi:hypothetical protein
VPGDSTVAALEQADRDRVPEAPAMMAPSLPDDRLELTQQLLQALARYKDDSRSAIEMLHAANRGMPSARTGAHNAQEQPAA